MAQRTAPQGHYCRVCGSYKSHEKFSGKGHSRHICKACMSGKCEENTVPQAQKREIALADTCCYNCERRSLRKLSPREKIDLKNLIFDVVREYWLEKHQIPFGGDFSDIKKHIIRTYAEECGVQIKDDRELKEYLHTQMISVLNKLLKAEKMTEGP